MCVSLYAFHLGQISTVLGQVDHDGKHGNAARTPIRSETSETDHTQKRRFRHTAIYQTIKALAILRCLSPSRRREAPCEGTNSPRLFTPGEREALAKSKVHQ